MLTLKTQSNRIWYYTDWLVMDGPHGSVNECSFWVLNFCSQAEMTFNFISLLTFFSGDDFCLTDLIRLQNGILAVFWLLGI